MWKILCRLLVMLLILSVTTTSVNAQETNDVSFGLDHMVNSLVGAGNAKGSVLSIVRDGQIELCKGYGYADEYNNIPADGEKTAFRIGSVSKTFVAVAAQILNQEGVLDLHSDISDYLEPDFPSLLYPVTMHQLLTHTAGFEDMVTGIAVVNVSDTEPLAISVRKYLPEQVFKPGEVVSYSNYGIALAAYVVERVSNNDFAEFCQQEIFMPLNMNRTTFSYMHDTVYVSKPYLPDGSETLEPYMNLYPEGSAVSTAEDMAKYIQWLLNRQDNRVLHPNYKEELFTRQFTMCEELEGVGYTWNRKERNNKIYYNKKGETLNFYTRIVLYPQQKTGIFLSFNTYLPEQKINSVIQEATNILYGEEEQLGSYNYDTKANININGWYVNNWSSYNTPERLLRYLIPGKMLHIKEKDNRYSINGEELTLIGEDTYTSPKGILKFQKGEGKTIIATESAITFTRVSYWQSKGIQLTIPLIFFIFTLICLLMELLYRVRNKMKYNVIFLVSSLLQLISFCILCLIMYKGIVSFSLLAYTLPIMICGWIILVACAVGAVYEIYIVAKQKPLKLIPVLWILTGFLFCIWMFGLNII